MKIVLKSKEIDDLKDVVDEVGAFAKNNQWDPEKRMKLELGSLSAATLAKVVKVLERDKERNRAPLHEIEKWKQIMADPGSRRPATFDQLATVLKSFLAKVPSHVLFRQSEDGDALGYVVSDIGYRPAKKSRRDGESPACTWVKLVYHEDGKNETRIVRFYKEDIKNWVSCVHLLDREGYVPATKDSLKQYEDELVRYRGLRGRVGLQVIGVGRCRIVGEEKSWWGGASRSEENGSLDQDGRKARLVIELHEEGKKGSDDDDEVKDNPDSPLIDGSFWKDAAVVQGDDDDATDHEVDEDTAEEVEKLDVPVHPRLIMFNLEKHYQCWAHVNRVEVYKYDKTLGSKLVLKKEQLELINILVQRDRAEIKDIISGKAGGSIVMCSGFPGTGKTLTAEVFAETMERPLYVVQSSQLGTDPKELEGELVKVLARAARWGAILLIDESDVFIHERGDDMVQNAVVGVFLRVLEYYQGVLFMTTNRETIVDDAVLSRCTAQVKFELPDKAGQIRIWEILAELSKVGIQNKEIVRFASRHVGLSGRDVKGLLKLSNMVAAQRKVKVTRKLIEYVMQFKPTALSKSGLKK